MTDNDKRKIRDALKLTVSYLFFPIYLPHFCMMGKAKKKIYADVNVMMSRQYIKCGPFSGLIFLLHNNKYFRSLFYHRIGPIKSALISWIRKGCSSLIIPDSTEIGEGCRLAHPYSTVLNAERIGSNLVVRHCTTLGKKDEITGGRPIIGDNVTLGASVTIIGAIHIGDNATVGAGSVVVKDVPAGAIVAGNPARVISTRQPTITNAISQTVAKEGEIADL